MNRILDKLRKKQLIGSAEKFVEDNSPRYSKSILNLVVRSDWE